jgi:pentapeptide MXKDX repeat protein
MRDDDASVVAGKQIHFIHMGPVRRLGDTGLINNTQGVVMKSIAIAAFAAALLVSGGSAFAQASGAMSGDSMSKDAMSKDSMAKSTMSKDPMSKDAMAKDSMSKDGSKMKPDAMKKGDAMSK